MKPTRRPVLFTIAGSVVGAACATLVVLHMPRPDDDIASSPFAFAIPGTMTGDLLYGSALTSPSTNPVPSMGPNGRALPPAHGALMTRSEWMDLDAFGHIAPPFATRAAQATWNAPFSPTPSETVLGSPSEDDESGDAVAVYDDSVDDDATDEDQIVETEPSLTPGDVVDLTLTISPGETLMGLLLDQEIPRPTAIDAVEALKKSYDPRSLKAGQELLLTFIVSENSELLFQRLSFEPSVGVTVSLSSAEDGSFVAQKQQMPLVRHIVRYDGTIKSSLFEAAIKEGTPQRVLADMIRVFSYDVDFQRDIRGGDSFEIFYEQMDTADGRTARTGDLLFASLTLSGKRYQLYRFQLADGTVDYYNEKGEGVRKALLRTPINGARLSSTFGMRKHPVLGYSRMHKGVDFAAPAGTPIYAAGDGIVAFASFNRGYGNHVRLKHDSEFLTVYAHMQNIAKGIAPGVRVKQGQIIGFVGSTGMSTGPHLHYEIVRNGAHVNPAATRFAASKNLTGKELAGFQKERDRIVAAFKSTPSGTKLASAQ